MSKKKKKNENSFLGTPGITSIGLGFLGIILTTIARVIGVIDGYQYFNIFLLLTILMGSGVFLMVYYDNRIRKEKNRRKE